MLLFFLFSKGSFNGKITRIIYGVMEYCKTNKFAGLLLTIDFEKAFNTINWYFIDKMLQSFNFGQSLHKYIKFVFLMTSLMPIKLWVSF